MSSLTLRWPHYCKIQWRLLFATRWWSHSLRNSPKLCLQYGKHTRSPIQPNPVWKGNRCRFAINASFTKMIKVDLSPTRVGSSARPFVLLLLSIILVKSIFFNCEDTRRIVSTATVVLCKPAPCLWNYLPEDQLNFQSLWKVCYFLPYNMLFWKLEQWIEREFVHFVHSSLAIREYTKWANGLSIHCSSFQNVFLCYFKNIDSFFMCW